jgi:serine/threonine protein kinase
MKIGKVKILEELGKGAGSRVYRVRREEDSRDYALKVVPCDNRRARRYLEQVQNEYRIGSSLKHPNLIEIYCLEIEEGWFAGPKQANLLTQFAPGRTMDRLPLIPISRLVRVFERVASAVAHMHSCGIIHADLKPNNLILDSATDVKLIDFGIAQLRHARTDHIHATREFMAPETVKQKLIDERTDIYSFGATMYRLATLKVPPPALRTALKGEQAFEQQYVPANAVNPRVPAELSELIGQCLSYRRDHRPRSMEVIEKALAQLARGSELEPGSIE